MKSLVVKRSIVLAGHKTSVSLEDEFWIALKEVAGDRHVRCRSWSVASISSANTVSLIGAQGVRAGLLSRQGDRETRRRNARRRLSAAHARTFLSARYRRKPPDLVGAVWEGVSTPAARCARRTHSLRRHLIAQCCHGGASARASIQRPLRRPRRWPGRRLHHVLRRGPARYALDVDRGPWTPSRSHSGSRLRRVPRGRDAGVR
jgi:hypothetical protein